MITSFLLYSLGVRGIDWSNETTRRIVLANLVKGVYSLEHERQGKNPESWRWTDFGFELHRPLVDKHDGSYYGAIFRNKYPYSRKSPKFVIAFRGTLFTEKTFAQDLFSDAMFVCQRLHKRSRVEDAIANVLNFVDLAGGPKHVWLAGHSLGSAISLVVWRELVLNKKLGLETFLFNPPIVSSPSELSRLVGQFVKSLVINVLTTVQVREETNDNFNKLSSWAPHLFINESDPVCQGYPSYFENRNKFGASGAKHSVFGLVAKVGGRDFVPIHLIPSANLTITKSSSSHPLKAHKLDQWLEQDLPCRNKSYWFNEITKPV